MRAKNVVRGDKTVIGPWQRLESHLWPNSYFPLTALILWNLLSPGSVPCIHLFIHSSVRAHLVASPLHLFFFCADCSRGWSACMAPRYQHQPICQTLTVDGGEETGGRAWRKVKWGGLEIIVQNRTFCSVLLSSSHDFCSDWGYMWLKKKNLLEQSELQTWIDQLSL